MKKICATLLTIASAITVTKAQIAIEGGPAYSNLSIVSGGVTFQNKFAIGGTFGILGDSYVANQIFFQTGLIYVTNGCTIDKPGGSYLINTTVIPLNIEIKTGDPCHTRFFIGAGPYIGINSGGSYSVSAYGKVAATDGPISIGPQIRRLDLGFGTNFGVVPGKHTYIRFRYMMGLSNIVTGGDADNSIKTTSLSAALGYYFGRCRERKERHSAKGYKPNHWRGLSKGIYSRKPRYPRQY